MRGISKQRQRASEIQTLNRNFIRTLMHPDFLGDFELDATLDSDAFWIQYGNSFGAFFFHPL